jgi:hypothetical protein
MYTAPMAAMVRKQVYIEPRQDQFLKQRAAELGVTEADLIRQGITLLAQSPAVPALDPDAWADEEAVLDQRARRVPGHHQAWRFRREDIYEERLGHVSGPAAHGRAGRAEHHELRPFLAGLPDH